MCFYDLISQKQSSCLRESLKDQSLHKDLISWKQEAAVAAAPGLSKNQDVGGGEHTASRNVRWSLNMQRSGPLTPDTQGAAGSPVAALAAYLASLNTPA